MIKYKHRVYTSVFGILFMFCSGMHKPNKTVISGVNNCVDSLPINDTTLQGLISKYVHQIQNYELPIIAVRQRGDTTFYYVSAIIATNSIRRNPPTRISRQFGRETLLYLDKKVTESIDSDCRTYLLKRYVKILGVDVLNTKDGLPIGHKRGTLHDPVLIKIAKIGTHVMLVKPDEFPDFDYNGI